MRRLGIAARLIALGLLAAWLVAMSGGLILRTSVDAAARHGLQLRLQERAERVQSRLAVSDDGRVVYIEPRVGDDFAQIFSGWYWRIRGDDTLLRSRSLWDADIVFADASVESSMPAAGLHAARGPRDEALLGLLVPASLDGHALQLEVFGLEAQVSDALDRFDRLLVGILVSLFVLMGVTAVLQVRFGLRPLSRLRAAVTAVQIGAKEHVGGGYGPDLDPLARELDAVLERNARVVSRARSHAADLAHALKKPLALLASASGSDVTNVPAALVQRETASMARLIDRHLARAGSGAGDRRRFLVQPRASALLDLMRQIHASRNLHWHIEIDDTLTWRGEVTDFEEMLGNLLDNAGKWAQSRVCLTLRDSAGCVELDIDDDGPGLSPAQCRAAIERGSRFDQTVEGSGIGLAIVADIAATYDGALELSRSALGGLQARLTLPA